MKISNALWGSALAVMLAGCLGNPTRPSNFYVLNPEPGQPVTGRQSSTEPLTVALGPVELPEIYERPQIVTRTAANRIDLAEFERWGGNLNKDLTRVLAQNLMGRLNTDNVLLYPWSGRDKPDFQLSLRFFRLDGEPDAAAYLDGVWRLLDGTRGCELAAHRFRIEEPVSAAGYPGLVSAISQGLARLSQEMAQQVAAATPGCPG
ncbi:MAG: PqiC family protein [Gammaproteobacteria bacterium]|jgi:hypothetical protein